MNDRVVGIGGVFIKARDAEALRAWYARHLGLDMGSWGGVIFPGMATSPAGRDAQTTFAIFPATSDYFGDGNPFMLNFRVENLDGLLAELRGAGCSVDQKTESSEFGKFGWVTDPEGNRVELWEPPEA